MWLRFALVSQFLLGCAAPLTEARERFDEARYPEAISAYRELGSEVPGFNRQQLFEYSLYRGLSHLALGDAQHAERWLRLAKRQAEAAPGLADAEQTGRLAAAWRSMGHAPGE